MNVHLLTPWAFAVGGVALLGLALLVASERRSRRLCGVLGLAPRPGWLLGLDVAALIALGALLGLAAAQPVVSEARTVLGRGDAEAIAVFDVSRSMLARREASTASRLERARTLAKEFRAGLEDVPVGVASLTDRILPHLFPTLGANAFTATVDRAVEIERPPPERRTAYRATAFGALGDLARQNFFGRATRVRVAVVFTDGESVPFDLAALRARLLEGRVATYFVHVSHPDDRVYTQQGATERYRPDPRSRAVLDRLAREVNGGVHGESEIRQTLAAVRAKLGSGPIAPRGRELRAVALAPYAVAAAALPLGFVLLRRNF
jgi:hypothetical protein